MGGRVYGKYSRRAGMLADTNIELLARDGRLTMLVHRPVVARMDVYITADHNNTLCVGRGRMMGGVESEAENRGKRMLVVNKLADMGLNMRRTSSSSSQGPSSTRSIGTSHAPRSSLTTTRGST